MHGFEALCVILNTPLPASCLAAHLVCGECGCLPVVGGSILVEICGESQEGGVTLCGKHPDAAGIAILAVEEGEVVGESPSLAEAHGKE